MDDLGKTPLFLETPILVPDGGVILETPCLTTMMLGKRWFGPDPFGTAFVGIFSGLQLAVKTFEGLSWIMKASSVLKLELALMDLDISSRINQLDTINTCVNCCVSSFYTWV